MAVLKNLKNHVPVAAFAAALGVSVEMIAKMKRTGMVPASAFEKSGRHSYIHDKNARAALKTAKVGSRGRAPVWASIVGNKAGIARAKDLAARAAA